MISGTNIRPVLTADQNANQCRHRRQQQNPAQKILQAHAPRRRQIHRQRFRLDADTNNAFANVSGRDGAATVSGKRRKMLAFAFPHHLAAPAQFTSHIGRRQADDLEPRHCELPAIPAHPEAPVTLRAAHVAIAGPVVAILIGKPEAAARPDWRNRARSRSAKTLVRAKCRPQKTRKRNQESRCFASSRSLSDRTVCRPDIAHQTRPPDVDRRLAASRCSSAGPGRKTLCPS